MFCCRFAWSLNFHALYVTGGIKERLQYICSYMYLGCKTVLPIRRDSCTATCHCIRRGSIRGRVCTCRRALLANPTGICTSKRSTELQKNDNVRKPRTHALTQHYCLNR